VDEQAIFVSVAEHERGLRRPASPRKRFGERMAAAAGFAAVSRYYCVRFEPVLRAS
jgi:hypothetical protein